MNRTSAPYQEFIRKARRMFEERGCELAASESTLNGEYLLFTRNGVLHLVYCLPLEMLVTTIEIQICRAAQSRFRAKSSTVLAPNQFSPAALQAAQSLGIKCERV